MSALKRMEEQFAYHERLLESVEDAVVAVDENFVVTMWSKGAERILGWSAEEVMGRQSRDFVRFEMSDAERDALRQRVAEIGRVRLDVVVYRKDGTPVDLEEINVALRDEGGKICGFLGIWRDITDRKRAEIALRQASARTEEILESITDIFVALDREWRYTYVNERALREFEKAKGKTLTRADVLARKIWDLFPELVGTAIDDGYRRAVREQKTVEFEAYYAPTGSWVELRAYPSKEGLAVYERDVTVQKAAQEELGRRARQQAAVALLGVRALDVHELQLLMEEAVALVARTLDVEYAKLVELLPGGEECMIRADFALKGTVRIRPEPAGLLSQVGFTMLSGQAVVAEQLATETRFTLSPVERDLGAASAASVVISTREGPFGVLHALSKYRRRFSDDDVNFLQAMANVVGTAVERAGVERSLRDVREGERCRIARDLHDEALRGLCYALAETHRAESALNDPDAAAHLSRVIPALQQVGKQVRAAIYNLRLGGEGDRPFPDLLESLIGLHRSMAVECDVVLDAGASIPTGPLGRTGTQVLRIVGEALTNARRHSGARRVRVGLWGSDDKLWVEVGDDGCGFDVTREPDDVNHAGIKGMRERAGIIAGHLRIRSQPGAGTRVRLEVPLRKYRDDLESVRILLVEDHAAVREAVASAFDREPGFDVVGQAGSLAEARGMLEKVDVAVVDLTLPDGYGGDLIEELREASPQAQALVLTASLDRTDLARAVESGAAGFLNKTAHLGEVVESVRRLRGGEALLPVTEVVELLRFAGRQRRQERQDQRAISLLTPRERDVLRALALGLDSQGVADRLHITVRTERNHVTSILTKLGVHSRLHAVVFALRCGIVVIR